MYGNFSRVTFDRRRHVSRVLYQQGMVTLDADDNERVAVELDHRRLLALDLIGRHGTVAHAYRDLPVASTTSDDFKITGLDRLDFGITPERYWVGGYPCELEQPEHAWVPPDFTPAKVGNPAQGPAPREPVTYHNQPDHPDPPALEAGTRYLVYLEAWERHVTSAHHPDLRERALGDADTASQARIVWQAKVLPLKPTDFTPPTSTNLNRRPEDLLDDQVLTRSQARLAARALQQETDEEECEFPPEPRYRGPQNQLYRVEIHQGAGRNANPDGGKGGPSWKWSRDNASVLYPLAKDHEGKPEIDGSRVQLEHLGLDERTALTPGTVVEPVSIRAELLQRPLPLLQVLEVDSYTRWVTLVPAEAGHSEDEPRLDLRNVTFLRRWDHKPLSGDKEAEGKGRDGALPLATGIWTTLEDGIQVWFSTGANVRPGDYWLIPARTGPGNVEWPKVDGLPLLVPPHGVEHVSAPLALIAPTAAGVPGPAPAQDFRRVLRQTL
jgi:hypothetical protein